MTGTPAAAPSIPSRRDVIRAHKERGGRVVAVFPTHHPRALWRAFDILPVEVWGPPGIDTTPGDAHLQAYTCGIVRGGLSFVLSGQADDADLFVLPHACDSTQGLGSLLVDFVKPGKPVLPFYLPRGEGDAAAEFLADELRDLYAKLAEITGKAPTDAELREAIRVEEQADGRLAALHAARATIPLSSRDFYRVVRAREFLPAEQFAALATRVLATATSGAREERRTPVVVSGMVPEPMELFDALERAGLVAAGDDFTCTGRRIYPPGRGEEPFLRIATSMLGGAPDATRGCSVKARADHLIDLARRSGARAVVFHEVKFCEPEAYYLPQVKKALEAAGIRSLAVEVNPLDPLPDQIVTRLEALAESVS